MEQVLDKLPRWCLLAILGYVVVLISYAVFDNRRVQLWPPAIEAKGEPSNRTLPNNPWVSISTVVPKFPTADCPTRLPAALAMTSVANIKPATWGGEGGLIWFGALNASTVWLACPKIESASSIIIGAAGPDAEETKRAVDILIDVVSR